jgi:hypothetical protein
LNPTGSRNESKMPPIATEEDRRAAALRNFRMTATRIKSFEANYT